MYRITSVTHADEALSARLNALTRSFPSAAIGPMTYRQHHGDYVAAARSLGRTYFTYVEHDDQVIACVAMTRRRLTNGHRQVWSVYTSDVKLHADHRGKGVLRKLGPHQTWQAAKLRVLRFHGSVAADNPRPPTRYLRSVPFAPKLVCSESSYACTVPTKEWAAPAHAQFRPNASAQALVNQHMAGTWRFVDPQPQLRSKMAPVHLVERQGRAFAELLDTERVRSYYEVDTGRHLPVGFLRDVHFTTAEDGDALLRHAAFLAQDAGLELLNVHLSAAQHQLLAAQLQQGGAVIRPWQVFYCRQPGPASAPWLPTVSLI